MTTAQSISRFDLPEYQFLNPAINDMVALGIQAPIKFNGLVLNDRLRPDRFQVTELDGLGSPDIRDNRASLPADHGEIPYDAYWGGDTYTIEGTIHAGNLNMLGKMERDLRAAFGTLVELPMKWCWWDVHDEFSDAETSAAMWSGLAQFAVFPGDGTMKFVYGSSSLTNPAILYYALRQYIDHTTTIKFTLAPTTSGGDPVSYVGILAKCSSSSNYIYATASLLQLQVNSEYNGSASNLSASGCSLTAGQQYWLQLQMVGDIATLSVYQVDPILNPGALALSTTTATLAGVLSEQFGFTAPGFAGVYVGGQNASSVAIEDFRVDAIWPCDMVTNVRPISSPTIKNIVIQPASMQNADPSGGIGMTRFRRDFQVTVRASNPRLTQPTRLTTTTIALTSAAASVAFGRVYERAYPLRYTIPLNASGNPATISAMSSPIALCFNRGTWLAQPTITFYGGCSFPVLQDLDTGNFVLLDGTIAQGDVAVVNVAARTVTNLAGQSVFGLWDPQSTWLELAPRLNRYLFSAQSPVGAPYVTVSWSHTWK